MHSRRAKKNCFYSKEIEKKKTVDVLIATTIWRLALVRTYITFFFCCLNLILLYIKLK